MRVLVTGSAGFIGFHLARRLLADGHAVRGIDGMTPYYDQSLKRRRHEMLSAQTGFVGEEFMLEDARRLAASVASASADIVVHLAAQAGVRYSAENPRAYIESNIVGTFNLLEALQAAPCKHLLLASTSSVYGGNSRRPFSERDAADHPVSLYAATKKATEGLAHSYAHLATLPTTVMRFFTVYGPWGRPDMALFKFTRNILEGLPIDVYGAGNMTRDFTYVDDVVEAICRLSASLPATTKSTEDSPERSTVAPYRVVNIGGGRPVDLKDFIATIEAAVGKAAIRRDMPMQPGDVSGTMAATDILQQLTGFRPATPIGEGVAAFVAWYRDYYHV